MKIRKLTSNIKIYLASLVAIIFFMLFFFQYFSETLRLAAIKEEEKQMYYISDFSANVVKNRIDQYIRFMRTSAGYIASINFDREKSAYFLRQVSQSTDFKYMEIVFAGEESAPTENNIFSERKRKIYSTLRIDTMSIDGKDYLQFSYPITQYGTVKAQIIGYIDAKESLDTNSGNIFMGRAGIIYFRSTGEYLFAQNKTKELGAGTNILSFIQEKKDKISVPLEKLINAISSRQRMTVAFDATSGIRFAHIKPVGIADWYIGIFLPSDIFVGRVSSVRQHTVKLLGSIGMILLLFVLYIMYIESKSLKEIQMTKQTADNLVASIPGGVYRCRADKEFTYELVSRGLAEIAGYATPAELIEQQGGSFWNSIITEDRMLTRASVMSRLRRDGRFETVYRMKKQNGDIIYALCKGGIIEEENGNKSVCAVIIDITETQKTIEKLLISEGKYKAAISQADIYVSEYDTATDILTSSERAAEKLSAPPVIKNLKEYLNNVAEEHTDYKDIKIYKDALFKTVLTKEQTTCFYALTSGDGKKHHMKTTFTHVEDNKGELKKIIGISEDITAFKNAERRYIETQKYKDTIAKLYERIYEYNITKDTVVLGGENYVNHAMPKEINLSDIRESFVKKYIHPDDRQFVLNMLSLQGVEEYLKRNMSEFDYDYRCKTGSMSDIYTWKAAHISIFVDPSDRSVHTTWFVKDITETMTHKKQLLYQAERDLLTGLYNKTLTEEKIRETIQSNPNGHYSLIMMDIDNFKTVNDTMGHLYGDTVIAECAKVISEFFEATDIKGRTGGDEFIIFAEERSDKEGKAKTAALSDAITAMYVGESLPIGISVSCGISYYPSDGQSFETLYNKADIALYHSKDHGKNRISIYTSSMGESLSRKQIPTLKNQEKNSKLQDSSHTIFKALCAAKDTEKEVQSSLAALSDHYGFTTIHIFLKTGDEGSICTEIFRWTRDNNTESRSEYESALKKASKRLLALLDNSNVHLVEEDDFPAESGYGALIIGSVVASIKECGELKGFICIGGDINDSLSSDEIKELSLSVQIISVFMRREQYYKKRNTKIERLKKSIRESKEKIYIVDADTDEILFSNICSSEENGGDSHQPCYSMIYGFDSQCADCILKKHLDENIHTSENISVSKDGKSLIFAIPFEFYNGKNTYFVTRVNL